METLPRETTAADKRLIGSAIGVYVLAVLAVLPWVTRQLPSFPPTVTIFTTWMVFADLATAYVLGRHIRRHESRSLLLLCCAYLYSALMGIAHILTFPGAILRGAPFIGGLQITSYIYNGWKLGFALLVLAAVLVPQKRLRTQRWSWIKRISIAAVCVAVIAGVIAGLAAEGALPTLVNATAFTVLDIILSLGAVVIGMMVIALLLIRDIDKLLSLWLIAVMVFFCGDLLTSGLGGGRFTIGWYFGRTSGLVSACILCIFFLWRFAVEKRAAPEAVALKHEGNETGQSQRR